MYRLAGEVLTSHRRKVICIYPFHVDKLDESSVLAEELHLTGVNIFATW